ncbi:MAG: phosphotransferase [Candidatus Caldatribacteriota bacterium]|nr:phosphotransferase [Candidatus Caldatribacteriota bacterium]
MSETANLLDVKFSEDIFFELMPEWKNYEIKIKILNGGITNRLYRVHSKKGDVTVRIYGEKTEIFINRDIETENIKRIAKAGVSPRLIKYMPGRRVTIVEFIPGYVLKNCDFLKEELHEKIVRPIRKIHQSGIVFPHIFNPLNEVKKMYRILNNLEINCPEFNIEGIIKNLEKFSEIANIAESEFTVSHNDLLADNFVLVEDGYRGKYKEPMYLIDWEYAGMAPRYYDIADMFQEILVPPDVEKSIIEHYCEGKEFEKTFYLVNLFKPFPDIHWFLWSMIQHNISKIKFDFYNYGKVKYENAQSNIKFIQEEYSLKR